MKIRLTKCITMIIFLILFTVFPSAYAQFYIAQEDTQNGCYLSESYGEIWNASANSDFL